MRPPRIVLVGAVESTRRTLLGLLRNGAHVVGALGLAAPKNLARVSGYASLRDVAEAHGIPFREFVRINDAGNVETVRGWRPDLLFVVGLSQLVGDEMLAVPSRAGVGFHPTRLPEGRGRAPLAWIVHDGQGGAATFFELVQEADAGGILVQEPFEVSDDDDAESVMARLLDALDAALDRWIPRLNAGEWSPEPQDDARATFNEKRTIEDGWVDWHLSTATIRRTVRVAARPHPGAYSYLGDARIVFWKAELAEGACPYRGVPGCVLARRSDGAILVQAGDGALWVTDWESDGAEDPRPGKSFGYHEQDEIRRLRRAVADLAQRLEALENRQADRP